MKIEGNVWVPPRRRGGDGDLWEGQEIEVERSDVDEIAIHSRVQGADFSTAIYLTRPMAGFLAAAILNAAEQP